MNVVDAAIEHLHRAAGSFAVARGLSEEDAAALLPDAAAAVAAGLVGLSSTRDGRAAVDTLVDAQERGRLDDLPALLAGDGQPQAAAEILGAKLSPVSEAIAARSGVDVGIAAKALAVAAAAVLSLLRKHRAEDGIAAQLAEAGASLGRPGLAWLTPLGLVGLTATQVAGTERAVPGEFKRRGAAIVAAALLAVVGGVVALGVSLRGDGEDDDAAASVAVGSIATDTEAQSTSDEGTASSTETDTTPEQAGLIEGTFADALVAGGVYGNFITGLGEVGTIADDVLAAGPITIFAPSDTTLTDEELARLRATAGLLEPTLRYHIVPGTLTEAQIASKKFLVTLGGRRLPVSSVGGQVLVGGGALGPSASTKDATVYAIDKLLEPPATINEELSLAPITFEVNSAVITPEGQKVLDEAVAYLGATPIKLVVEGHTDADGAAPANLILSRARAISVRDYLVGKGVKKGLLRVKAFGEAKPVATNTTDAGKAKNRRIELRAA